MSTNRAHAATVDHADDANDRDALFGADTLLGAFERSGNAFRDWRDIVQSALLGIHERRPERLELVERWADAYELAIRGPAVRS